MPSATKKAAPKKRTSAAAKTAPKKTVAAKTKKTTKKPLKTARQAVNDYTSEWSRFTLVLCIAAVAVLLVSVATFVAANNR